jgi:hypothetical protein
MQEPAENINYFFKIVIGRRGKIFLIPFRFYLTA